MSRALVKGSGWAWAGLGLRPGLCSEDHEEIINITTTVFKCNFRDFRDGLYGGYQNKLNGLSGWYNSPSSEFALFVLLIGGVISSIKGSSSSSVSGTMCTRDFLPIALFISGEIIVRVER